MLNRLTRTSLFERAENSNTSNPENRFLLGLFWLATISISFVSNSALKSCRLKLEFNGFQMLSLYGATSTVFWNSKDSILDAEYYHDESLDSIVSGRIL